MKSAKEFYEVYDISHPQQLTQRENLMFESLINTQEDFQNKIASQRKVIEFLNQEETERSVNQKMKLAGLAGLIGGFIVLFGLLVNNSEKHELKKEVKTLTQRQEFLQKQFQRREQELSKRIEILVKQNEELKAGDIAILKEENARLKTKNANLNSEIIRVNRRCVGKLCLR